MWLSLIAPIFRATPRSAIGRHTSRTASLCGTRISTTKRHVFSFRPIPSLCCSSSALARGKFLQTCRRNNFVFSLYTNTPLLLQQNQIDFAEKSVKNMNFRGGCCIARYGGGGGGYDMSKVDRIMLRYRPIAPRPDSGGSYTPPEKNELASANVSSKSRRGKRKYSKDNSSSSGSVNSNGNIKRCNRRKNENGSGVGGEMVTLSLLPETPEKKKEVVRVLTPELDPASLWLSFGDGASFNRRYQTDLRSELVTETVVSSLLTVECITERDEEVGYELACTDDEIKMKLEKDTCPGFISDGLGRVIWTNVSYTKLVFGKEEECSKMSVWLVMKEKPLLTQRTFTCRMRLQYTCRDKEVSSITSFCDVWRMNDGGFAWRFDVDAALCLGP